MLHFGSVRRASSAKSAEELRDEPAFALLHELWSGDPAHALSRVKLLAGLRSGPVALRAFLCADTLRTCPRQQQRVHNGHDELSAAIE